MRRKNFIPAAVLLCLLFVVSAFVFPQQGENQKGVLTVSPLPLPGETARDFELVAVLDNDISKVKLSDFRGKWTYLTFIPAAFTFV